MEAKKMALIRILQILLEHSNINHPLTHEMIAQRLYNDYGIEIERKAIGRHINDLIEMFEKESINKSIYPPHDTVHFKIFLKTGNWK